MKKLSLIIGVVIVLAGMVMGQATGNLPIYVTVTGNSIAQYQWPFGEQEFPAVAPAYHYIYGAPAFTCAMVYKELSFLVPAHTQVLVLIDSTNDVRTGVSVSDHMACMNQSIGYLVNRNPRIKIVVVNTPPWTENNCLGLDRRQAIAAYNAAYVDPNTGLAATWPGVVTVVDAWSLIAQPDGWADPNLMIGSCGIHPGVAYQWSGAWQNFASSYEAVATQLAKGLYH